MPQPQKTQMDLAYRAVRGHLLKGSAGRLSRRELARELDFSQACVQAALSRLEGEGLVEIRAQSGSWIRVIDAEEYHRVYDLRELLESYAAGRAATRITARQSARLDRALRDHASQIGVIAGRAEPVTKPTEVTPAVAAQHLFHSTILEAADNPTAHHFVENLQILGYYAGFALSWARSELVAQLRAALVDHEAIADAIRSGQAQRAEQLMREHIQRSRVTTPQAK